MRIPIIALLAALTSLYPAPATAQGNGSANRYDCVIQPKSVVDLGTAETGVLTEILVGRGQIVHKGEPVARLESELQRLQAELMRLRASATAEVESSRARHVFRTQESARMGTLYRKKIVSTKQMDEAKIEKKLAGLNVTAAEMNRKLSGIELRQAEARLARRTIRSPTKGIVKEVSLSVGEYVHERVSILKIAEIDPLHVEVFLPANLYREVRRGTRALVYPQAPIGGRYPAVVDVVDKVFDAASETFGLRLILKNEDYILPAGLRCRIEFLRDG